MKNNNLLSKTRAICLSMPLLAATLPGASITAHAASVEVDYDTGADFSRFTYYQWQQQSDNVDAAFAMLGSGNVQDALSSALDQNMMLANAQHPPEFLVRYYISEVKKMVDDRPRVGIGIGGMNDNVGGGFSFSIPLGGDNLDKQAHIVIDFLDQKTQKLIWRGSLVTGMSSTSTEINQRQVQKAAVEIMKKFPPR